MEDRTSKFGGFSLLFSEKVHCIQVYQCIYVYVYICMYTYMLGTKTKIFKSGTSDKTNVQW